MAEAKHQLGRVGGWPRQRLLWRTLPDQSLLAHDLTAGEVIRAGELMGNYVNMPMDLADASLMAAVGFIHVDHFFTFDKDFFM